MNPVASTGNTALTDGNDQASAAFDAARFAVTLPRLDGSGVLRGTWADAFNANQRASEPGLGFAYDRHDDHFEEVMAYYHLDRAQDHIQALGFTDVNHRVQVARVNAMSADNSFYSPQAKDIRYGTGGVDDFTGDDSPPTPEPQPTPAPTTKCAPPAPTCAAGLSPQYSLSKSIWECTDCSLVVTYGGIFGNYRRCVSSPTITCPVEQVPTYSYEGEIWECKPTCDNGMYDQHTISGQLVCVPC